MKVLRKKKVRLIGIVLFSLVVIAFALIIKTNFCELEIAKEFVTVEVGDTLNLDVEEFIKADAEVLSQIKIDTSDVDMNKTGEYVVRIFYDEKEYKINVLVADTKAPTVTLKNRCVFVNDIENLIVEELFESVQEFSDFEAMFTAYEKETDLDIVTEEKIKTLEELLLKPSVQGILAEKKTEKVPTEEGIYRCVIKVEDIHGNARYEEIFIIMDKTPPVIEGISDVTIETSDLSKEPEIDIDDYKTTDNVDGTISSSDVFYELERTDNENHIYVNHISAKDRAGNVCTKDVKITLVQKKVASTGNVSSSASNSSGETSGTNSNGNNSNGNNSSATLSCEISGFPVVMQMPELPTGCEVTALTMLLNYYGCSVSKTTMASNYLPQVTSGYTGRVDLDYYFCGNPYGVGIGCGAGALVTAANSYFADSGSSLRGVDITGSSAETLYGYISDGKPVVVMATIGMANRKPTKGWHTSEGKYVDWSENDHGVVLIGCDSNTVKIACPLYGIKTYNRAQFEKAYSARGNKAMIVQ